MFGVITPIVALLLGDLVNLARSQTIFYPEILNAGVSALTLDNAWVEISGNSDDNAGIFASYSLTTPVEAPLLVLRNADGSLITGCARNSIPRNNGSIVILARGDCAFRVKSENVQLSGGAAMLLRNQQNAPNPLWMSAGRSANPYSPAQLIVSVAIPFDIGNRLLNMDESNGPSTPTIVRIVNKGSYNSVSGPDRFRSQIIFYSAGVAIAAMVLVMATRVCRRRVPYNLELATINRPQVGPSVEKQQELMASLETYEYVPPEETLSDEESNSCCICICDYEAGEKIVKLPCKHEFHEPCIAEWLREHVDCPLCKADVYAMVFSPQVIVESVNVETGINNVDSNTGSRGVDSPHEQTPMLFTVPRDDSSDDDDDINNNFERLGMHSIIDRDANLSVMSTDSQQSTDSNDSVSSQTLLLGNPDEKSTSLA